MLLIVAIGCTKTGEEFLLNENSKELAKSKGRSIDEASQTGDPQNYRDYYYDNVHIETTIDADFGILNANYFKGAFNEKFDKAKTTEEDFTPDNGTPHKVKTMCGEQTVRYYESDEMTVVQMKFGNGAYRLNLILPGNLNLNNPDSRSIPTVKTMQHLLTSLTPASWTNVQNNLYTESAILHLPKFSFEYKTNIKSALELLGVSTIYQTHDYNTGILADDNEAKINYSPVSTYIKVDETGAETASVSMITGTEWAANPPITIRINRSFMFIIDEASTGLILYAGIVNDL